MRSRQGCFASCGPLRRTNENQGSLDPRFWVGRRFGQPPPFVLESSGKVPICYRAEIISVDLLDYFWYFTHGGLPARDCYVHR